MDWRDVEHRDRRFWHRLCGGGCLMVHVGLFLVVATGLTLVNVARSPEDLWSWRLLAWWGVGLALHAAATAALAFQRAAGGVTAAPAPRRAPPALLRAPDRLRSLVHSARRVMAAPIAGPIGDADHEDAGAAWSPAGESWPAAWTVANRGWRATVSETLVEAVLVQADRARTVVYRLTAGTRLLSERRRGETTGPGVGAAAADTDPAGGAGFTPVVHGANGWSPYPAAPVSPFAEDGSGDLVPPAIAALWATPAAVWSSRPSAPDPGSWPTADPAPPTPNPAPVPAASGEDIVVNGPIAVDAEGPQWVWLGAAATAWLARREADAATAVAWSTLSTHPEGYDGVGGAGAAIADQAD